MKFNNPLRKMLNRQDQIDVLNASFAATEQISDPGLRLQRLKEISDEAAQVIGKVNDKAIVSTLPPALLGIGCVIGGAATANPVLAGAGVVIMGGSLGARATLGNDAFKALWDLRARCETAEKNIVDTVTMKELAKSERFDHVMKQYPQLKEKFLLAASREKILSAEEPAAKPEAPRNPGGFSI